MQETNPARPSLRTERSKEGVEVSIFKAGKGELNIE